MSATRAGTRPCARKASATFRRRSCCVGPREGEAPARTLRTALHGPGGRRPATLAERRLDAAEPHSATLAHLRSGTKAKETPLRKDQIEHVTTTLETGACRVCVSSVNTPCVPADHAGGACGCRPRAADSRPRCR